MTRGSDWMAAASPSAIVPIQIGDEARALQIAQTLLTQGIFLSAIRYPTVQKQSARLRAAIMSTHTKEDLTKAAQKIAVIINQQ